MKYFILIWGSLTVISYVSLLHCFSLLFLAVQYIYSCLLVCTYCRILSLCTTWFVNNPFSCGEPSPIPSNYNNKAQGPCFSLDLDTIQKGTLTVCKNNFLFYSIISVKLVEMNMSHLLCYIINLSILYNKNCDQLK